jgi:hypothetical protein
VWMKAPMPIPTSTLPHRPPSHPGEGLGLCTSGIMSRPTALPSRFLYASTQKTSLKRRPLQCQELYFPNFPNLVKRKNKYFIFYTEIFRASGRQE